MANIKSNQKRAKTNLIRHEALKSQKSALKSALKKVESSVKANDKEAAIEAIKDANSKLDKAVTSNIHHKNYASRKKSSLQQLVNKM